MTRPVVRWLFLVCLACAGCLSTNPPATVRYFNPAPPGPAQRMETGGDALVMRLVPPTSAAHLRDRMVWRLSPVELTFDESHRWIEEPAVFVSDFITFTFGAEVTWAQDLRVPQLSIYVAGFEAVVETQMARVELHVTLTHDGQQRSSFHAVKTAPLEGSEPADLAVAMGAALAEACADVRAWALAAMPSQ